MLTVTPTLHLTVTPTLHPRHSGHLEEQLVVSLLATRRFSISNTLFLYSLTIVFLRAS